MDPEGMDTTNERKGNATWWRSQVLNLLTLIVVTLPLLLGMEAFCRFVRPVKFLAPPTAADANAWRAGVHQAGSVPGLAYELKPNIDSTWREMHVCTNNYGMREGERTKAKPENTVRIAAIGDSYTFGFGVHNDDAWPHQLEGLLNAGRSERDTHYEVLNFGVGGYTTRDESLVIQYKALDWQPDLIILGYVTNDPEICPDQPLPAYFHQPALWEHSALLRGLALMKRNLTLKYGYNWDYLRFWHDPRGKGWRSVLDAFDRIAEVTKARGIPVIVAIFPDPPLDVPPENYLAQIYRQVGDAARQRGFDVLNLTDAFKGYDYEALRQPQCGNHLNPKGYELTAKALRDLLVRQPDKFLKKK